MEIKKDILINALHMLKEINEGKSKKKFSKIVFEDEVYSLTKDSKGRYFLQYKDYDLVLRIRRRAEVTYLLDLLDSEIYIIYDDDYTIPEVEIVEF